jgi:hypothetical protein
MTTALLQTSTEIASAMWTTGVADGTVVETETAVCCSGWE